MFSTERQTSQQCSGQIFFIDLRLLRLSVTLRTPLDRRPYLRQGYQLVIVRDEIEVLDLVWHRKVGHHD